MTIRKNPQIPGQAGRGEAGKHGQDDQDVEDDELEALTGGAGEWPEDDNDPDVDLDMVEGSIRLRPGSDLPDIDK